MAQNPLITAAAAEGGLVQDTLLTAIIERGCYTLKVSESLGDLEQETGQIIGVVFSMATGYFYIYDENDTTSAEDGVTILVDGSSHRYKIMDGAILTMSFVKARQNDPPSTPSPGEVWIVGVSPTGDWAGQAATLALWTVRGWFFAEPEAGISVLNEATGLFAIFNESGEWTGLPILGTIELSLDEQATELTATGVYFTNRARYPFTLLGVRASLKTASTSGAVTVDVLRAGSTVLSTKCVIPQGSKTSLDGPAPVISSASFSDDQEYAIEVEGVGDNAVGLMVCLYVRWNMEMAV